MYCGMPKVAKAMPNSDKIKPVALAIIKLLLSEGVSWSVGRSVSFLLSQSVSQLLTQSVSQ